MGSNDHYPVPDPTQEAFLALSKQNVEDLCRKEKTPSDIKDLETIIASLDARVDQLEKDMQETRGVTGAVWKRDSLSMNELKSKLRQTIEAVKKLAKGKSLGALGLPSEEEWDQGL